MQTQAPLFPRRRLVSLIWPLLLEQTLSVTMGMADTLMVSGVGEAAVSSVSLVDTFNVLIVQIVSALATGGAVVASQYMGHRDTESARRSAAQLYSVLGICTLALTVVCLALSRPLLRFIFGSIDDEVMVFAQQYLLITAVSYPFIGFYNGGAALFRAQGNSRISMLASLVMNVINIAGNALLIYVFKLGVIGAALATLIGRIFAAAWLIHQNQAIENPLRIHSAEELRPRKDDILRILAIGIPSGLENGMFQIGKLCVSSLTSTLGTSAIAANAVANSVSTMANIPGNTISLAMIPVVGQCLGAGDKKQARHYALVLLGIAMAGLLVTNLALYLLIPELVLWFSLSAEAAALCIHVVRWFDIFSVFFWVSSFSLPNALRSGGDTKYTMTVSIASMWIFRVMLSYFFVLQLHMGLTGVWFGMFIDWICRGVFFWIRFLSGKWMEHKVI